MANMAGKVSEVKLWGTGGCWARHRSVACKGRQTARRDYSRAARREARKECRAARLGWADGAEVVTVIGEDADSHVELYEARLFDCNCSLCVFDDYGADAWTYDDEDRYQAEGGYDPFED